MTGVSVLTTALLVGYIGYVPKGTPSSSQPARPESAEALIVVDGPENVSFSDEPGGRAVTYTLRTPYPARDFVREIGTRLLDMGWDPQEESYANPGMPTSHVRGWQDYIDGTVEPEKLVHQWWGEWLNEYGNLLTYVLEYRDTVDDAQHSPILQVSAILIMAPIAPRRGLDPDAGASELDRVFRIARDYREAWLAQDWESMNQLVDPLWTLTDWDGRVRETKDVFGPDEIIVISSWEDDDVEYRSFGYGVVLSGRRTLRVQNIAEPIQLRFTDFLAKQHGEWRIVVSHWSLMPEPSPTP